MVTPTKSLTRKIFTMLTGLLFGGIFIWLAMRNVDVEKVREILSNDLQPPAAIFALLCYLCYFWVKSHRWHLLLKPILHIKPKTLFPYIMLGYLGNLIVPFQLGEAYRGYRLSKARPISITSSLSTIFLEKVLDIFMVLSFVVLALTLSDFQSPSLRVFELSVVWGFAALTIFVVAILLKPENSTKLGTRLLSVFPDTGIFNTFYYLLARVIEGLSVLESGRHAMGAMSATAVAWLLMLATLYLSLMSVGIEPTVPMSAAILFLSVIGLTLPTSPGYVGTIQLAFVFGAQPFGISQESALAASVFYNTLIVIPPAVIGLFCLPSLRRNRS